MFIVATILLSTTAITSCKKKGCTDSKATNYNGKAKKDDGSCQYPLDVRSIPEAIAKNVIVASYNDLASKSATLNDLVVTFASNPTSSGLTACKDQWMKAREAWERTEGYLYGPAENDEIDPRIDTWPVEYAQLDSIIGESVPFTQVYIETLADAHRGFHPFEYLLWGQNGNKTAEQFTAREMEYLKALGINIKDLTADLADKWKIGGSFYNGFIKPTSSNETYKTMQSVFVQIVDGLADIAKEVADEKLREPFEQEDPSLEESPFAKNSFKDFKDNIRSIENVYLGKYSVDGAGLEDFVREYNLSLDSKIKSQIADAIAKLDAFTVPFGEAITEEKSKIVAARTSIQTLEATLSGDLVTLIKANIKD